MNASWIIPFIILGGALQSCGAAMNGSAANDGDVASMPWFRQMY